jgi:hypothetical protein
LATARLFQPGQPGPGQSDRRRLIDDPCLMDFFSRFCARPSTYLKWTISRAHCADWGVWGVRFQKLEVHRSPSILRGEVGQHGLVDNRALLREKVFSEQLHWPCSEAGLMLVM